MKTFVTAALAMTLAGASAHVLANADLSKATELAKANGCYSCHAKDEKVVGPAFKAIAAKYAGDSGATATLVQSIQNGSKGKWGRIPMPAHSSMSGEDLKTLAQWVLSQKD
ncbi:c-type cytochrome [Macromonas nakdongensis]|uniref:c-type cytochrome n=1 Tax=Macromonas nakdongensis TaxID=1843082 RepID=UPI000C32275B|nr:c-type cytochrome [Macromonas nakdongensis]